MVSALVVASGDCAEVLETVDGSLDDIAPLVGDRIECRRATAVPAPTLACGHGITAFGADTSDAAPLDDLPMCAGTICPIHPQAGRSLAWPAGAAAWHCNGVKHRRDLGHVGALPGGDRKAQRTCMAVDTQVDLARQSSTRAAKPLVAQSPLFSADGAARRAPVALRWAFTCVASSAAPSQSICPAASACACNARNSRCHVPLRDQRTYRS